MRYGLILIDIRMSCLTAFELAKVIHKDSLDIPARFMTAFEIDSVEYKETFPAADPSEFVSKLMSMQKLVELVTKYIRNS
jgi:CheY-like chemotaxis protein